LTNKNEESSTGRRFRSPKAFLTLGLGGARATVDSHHFVSAANYRYRFWGATKSMCVLCGNSSGFLIPLRVLPNASGRTT
jgi:hypothetical protein